MSKKLSKNLAEGIEAHLDSNKSVIKIFTCLNYIKT